MVFLERCLQPHQLVLGVALAALAEAGAADLADVDIHGAVSQDVLTHATTSSLLPKLQDLCDAGRSASREPELIKLTNIAEIDQLISQAERAEVLLNVFEVTLQEEHLLQPANLVLFVVVGNADEGR